MSALDVAAANVSRSTAKHYAADFRRFSQWCAVRGRASVPATLDSVMGFVEDELDHGFAASTIARRLAAIAAAHDRAGEPVVTRDPRVRRLLDPG